MKEESGLRKRKVASTYEKVDTTIKEEEHEEEEIELTER